MRRITGCAISLLLAACGGSGAGSAPIELQTLYVLPNGQYQVGGTQMGDLAVATKYLGSPSHTRVNVSACSSAQSASVLATVRQLEAAGYEEVGFVVADPAKQPACRR
jgi:hypothetical protein